MSEPITAAVVRAAELTARGFPRQAIDLLRPALAANPLNAEAWCRLAAAHLDVGEPDPALDAAKRALVLDGDHAWAQRLAALALSELGRHTEAVVAARECVRRKPGDWRCRVVLAEVLAATPETRREAVDAAKEAARLAPAEARAFQVLGDAALRIRDWGTAEWAYRRALRLDPADEDVRANLATVQRKRGGAAPAPPSADALTVAHALAWAALSRLAALLVGGGLLLLLAGMPTPTALLGWFSGLLVAAVAAVLLQLLVRARRGVRKALFALPRHRPKVAAATTMFGLSTVVVASWTVALFLGATTMQPLVIAWLCAVLGGAVVVLGGGR
ncbi:tetratricopeptide repeat protein [Actinosynnema sp. CS-041913]|uniref:tetratricopeptide repeat protein n=1 Tax=Actinosynnema sp. CS-041913 TaxID=3239917 RepID=UPI003D8CD3C4